MNVKMIVGYITLLLTYKVLICILLFADLSCHAETSYFYIYDWPGYMDDVWPEYMAKLDEKSPYSHDFRGNNGAGKALKPDLGYFSTWQFSLYRNALSRLRASEYRTLDPKSASVFIIPFDIGAHSFVDHVNGKARVASPHGWRAVEYIKEAMKSEIFWKNKGHDHFVFFSVTSYQIIGIGAKIFLTQPCQNCSVLTIETSPTFTSRKYYSNKSKKWWFAVPYPSSFHWWEGIKQLPWKANAATRPYLAMFIGSVETQTPDSNIARRRMHADCLKDNKTCLWFDTAHSCSGIVNQTDNMLMYLKSTFCLAPPGDSLTRKSLFDSIATGCIPVINARASITQYFWHISPEEVDLVSVYIPRESINDYDVNFLSVLKNISTDRIREMQLKLEEIAPRLQYSMVPLGYGPENSPEWKDRPEAKKFGNAVALAASNTNRTVGPDPPLTFKGLTWKPPFRDAMDVIIDRLLNRSTIEPMEGFAPGELEELQKRRDSVFSWNPAYVGNLPGGSELVAGEDGGKGVGHEGGRGKRTHRRGKHRRPEA